MRPTFFSTQASTTYCERARLKSSVKYLKSPSCRCAPPGCPQSGANRKSIVSLHSLGADLQRQFQLLHRLIIEDANGSANVHIISVLDGETGERLKSRSQTAAEGAKRDGEAFYGSRPTEGTPEARQGQSDFSDTLPSTQRFTGRIGSGCVNRIGKEVVPGGISLLSEFSFQTKKAYPVRRDRLDKLNTKKGSKELPFRRFG